MSWAAFGANPFFMFDAADPGASPVLQKYFQNGDYLGVRTVQSSPQLGTIAGRAYQIELEPTLARVKQSAASVCRSTPAAIVFYLWGATPSPPPVEAANPVGSVQQALAEMRAAGCERTGLAPEPTFFGYQPGRCTFDLNTGAYRQIDWRTVDWHRAGGGGAEPGSGRLSSLIPAQSRDGAQILHSCRSGRGHVGGAAGRTAVGSERRLTAVCVFRRSISRLAFADAKRERPLHPLAAAGRRLRADRVRGVEGRVESHRMLGPVPGDR